MTTRCAKVSRSWRAVWAGILSICAVHGHALARDLPKEFHAPGVRVEGRATGDGRGVTFAGRDPRLVINPPDPESYEIEVEVMFGANSGAVDLAIGPDGVGSDAAVWRTMLRRRPGKMDNLLVQPMSRTRAGKWSVQRGAQRALPFLPSTRSSRRGLAKQWWKLAVVRSGSHVRVNFDGQTLLSSPLSDEPGTSVVLKFDTGDRVRQLRIRDAPSSAWLPLELGRAARQVAARDTGEELSVGGVPFRLADAGRSAIDLGEAMWPEWRQDPSNVRESYDQVPPHLDPNRPMLWAPTGDYVALHLLLSAKRTPRREPSASVTIGSFGIRDQVRHYAFEARVPPSDETGIVVAPLRASNEPVVHVRVPLYLAGKQALPDVVQIAFSKQLRLAVRQPDPSRFRYRPLGVPSGVRVWGATLERSPIEMEVHSDEPGHAFVDPAIPTFRVQLTNRTPVARDYELRSVAVRSDGQRMFQERWGEIEPGAREEVILRMPVVRRGYYEYRIELRNGAGELLLARSTSFAWLMPRPREDRNHSPFGTWDFSGSHFTSADAKLVGSLYEKLGFRYGMFGFTLSERTHAGVIQGREPVVLGTTDKYVRFREKNPDAPRVALLMHEHSVSPDHLHRAPDLFHDRGTYAMNATEQSKFKDLLEKSLSAARAMRALEPEAHLRLGNGGLPLKEELYRHGFPGDLFDSAGNEAASFGRPPEAQPPDIVAMNASLWMDRRLLDHYGYTQKPVTQCFETCYPSSNPGNLSLQTQANYFARHALHALAWQLPSIRLGMIMDAGNSYYHSNWGASGLCTSLPEVRAKPAFVALATLAAVLEGARFEKTLDLGSASLYGLEFSKPKGRRLFALWTLRGGREIHLRFAPGAPRGWTLTDGEGNVALRESSNGMLTVKVNSTPIYLEGRGPLQGADPGTVDHRDSGPIAQTTVLSTLGDLDGWIVDNARDMDLEFHNPLTPRKNGVFIFEPVGSFEGESTVLRVSPIGPANGADTMPLYSALRHLRGLSLPGKPTAVGLWVNGNSSFGRIVFHLEDATGQRWISIGASSKAPLPGSLLDSIPKEHARYARQARQADWNTDDVFGLSRFDFDGWRYLSFPLPGNYPGEGYGWPANSQWMHDGDGRVRYPLKLRRLILELPQKALHVREFTPPRRADVYLKRLVVEHGDTGWRAPLADGSSSRDSLQ